MDFSFARRHPQALWNGEQRPQPERRKQIASRPGRSRRMRSKRPGLRATHRRTSRLAVVLLRRPRHPIHPGQRRRHPPNHFEHRGQCNPPYGCRWPRCRNHPPLDTRWRRLRPGRNPRHRLRHPRKRHHSHLRGGLQRQRRNTRPRFSRIPAPYGSARRRDSCNQPHQRRKYVSVGVSSPMTSDEVLSVMVVDDEPGIRTALRANFLRHGWRVETASSVRDAIRGVEGQEFDLVVTDMRMPDGTGMEVMQAARKAFPETAVILLTAYGSVPDAVNAMRDGALDYLTKPIPFDRLQATAAQVMNRTKQLPVEDLAATGHIVGHAPSLHRTLHRARAAASTGADVLIEAESGTGKELLARFIHDSSNRSTKPFVAVNCAAVPESLLESELFGHGKGAFTGAVANRSGKFELANGGTILLDEIGEMPLNLQPKLLRVLQGGGFDRLGESPPGHVDIRVIATTIVSLAAMVERGQFRADLYYRLNVIPLSLPPLRERREDIPVLARYFAEKYAAQQRSFPPRLHPDFLDRLQSHSWPGNGRG